MHKQLGKGAAAVEGGQMATARAARPGTCSAGGGRWAIGGRTTRSLIGRELQRRAWAPDKGRAGFFHHRRRGGSVSGGLHPIFAGIVASIQTAPVALREAQRRAYVTLLRHDWSPSSAMTTAPTPRGREQLAELLRLVQRRSTPTSDLEPALPAPVRGRDLPMTATNSRRVLPTRRSLWFRLVRACRLRVLRWQLDCLRDERKRLRRYRPDRSDLPAQQLPAGLGLLARIRQLERKHERTRDWLSQNHSFRHPGTTPSRKTVASSAAATPRPIGLRAGCASVKTGSWSLAPGSSSRGSVARGKIQR